MRAVPRIAVALAAIVLASPVAANGQDMGLKPTLLLTVRPMTLDGSTSRPSAIERSAPEISGTTYLMAGRLEDPDGQLCSTRAASGEVTRADVLERSLKGAQYVWKITSTAVKYENGRHTFGVEWQRFDGGTQTAAASGKQQLTLADGQTYTLDFVRGNPQGTCRTPGAVVEITAGVREDPAFADTVLRYDLWLVRQDRSGKKETHHTILTGGQGTLADFRFAPLRTPVPKLQPNHYDFAVAMRVRGSVRGRLTRDGRVTLELETLRSNRLERPSSAPPSELLPRSGTGRKMLNAALGETIEIELPPATGYTSTFASESDERSFKEQMARGVRASPGGKPPQDIPVTLHDGRLVVNYGPFFEGERLSLIVQVRKMEGPAEPGAGPKPEAGSPFLPEPDAAGVDVHEVRARIVSDAAKLQ